MKILDSLFKFDEGIVRYSQKLRFSWGLNFPSFLRYAKTVEKNPVLWYNILYMIFRICGKNSIVGG